MMRTKRSYWTLGIILLLLGILGYLLYWRFLVSSIRFFDVDEFSYMHWAADVARGEHMYTDFFSYFTPGFMWVMAPIYWIVGRSASVFMAGRVFAFVIFLSILGSLSYLWGMTRGWKWALLPAVILAFLPMPYDKFLEIRPDNLSTMLGVLGVIGEIRGLQSKKAFWWLVSGLAYSASLFVLAKTLSFVAVGAGIAILSVFSSKAPKSLKALRREDWKELVFFFTGLFGPWVVFFFGAAIAGHFATVWYSLTKLPFEVYESVKNYPMEADLFFFPNASFYGLPAQAGGNGDGITSGLIINHILWALGILVGAHRVVTPFREGNREKGFIELLLGIIFFASIFGYVKFFPLKHIQYLIPIAVFIAYYAADGLSVFFDWIARIGGFESLAILLIGFAYILISTTKDVNAQKLLVPNTQQLDDLTLLIKTIPFRASVVDLEGRMVFWPDAYPVSSLPIDSTLSFVTRAPAPLYQYLPLHPAQYIWDGDSGRLNELTAQNIAYIKNNYSPVAGWGGRLLKQN